MFYNNWKKYLPCTDNHQVPKDVRPEFVDLATFTGGMVLPVFNANPTGYKAVKGSLFYNSNDDTLYYRSSSGFQALGVSGTPAPSVFPIQANSATTAATIFTSTITPDVNPTWSLAADGTQQFSSGAGALLGQLRYDTLTDRLTWEDTVGQFDGKFQAGTVFTATLNTNAITTTGTTIGFSSKNVNNVGTLSATSVNVSGQLSTQSITSGTSNISFNNVNLTNVTNFSASVGTFSTSLSVPSISGPSSTINFNSNTLNSVNAINGASATFSGAIGASIGNITSVTANTTTTTNLVVSNISTGGVVINYTGSDVSNIHAIEFQNVSSGSLTQPITFYVNTQDIDFNSHYLLNCGKMIFKYPPKASSTDNRIELWKLNTDTLARLYIDQDGTMNFTNGTDAIFGSQGWFGKGGSGEFTMGFTKGATDGTLKLGVITGTAGLTIQATSGSISTVGALTNNTSISSPLWTTSNAAHDFNNKNMTNIGTITASTLQGTTYTKVGGSLYPVPAVLFSVRAQSPMGSGTATYQTVSLPANAIANNGDKLEVECLGACANNSATKTVGITLGGTGLTINLAPNTTTINDWLIRIVIWRASATTIDWNLSLIQNDYQRTAQGRTTSVSTFANAQNLVFTCTTGNLADVTFNAASVVYYPKQ